MFNGRKQTESPDVAIRQAEVQTQTQAYVLPHVGNPYPPSVSGFSVSPELNVGYQEQRQFETQEYLTVYPLSPMAGIPPPPYEP